LRWQSPASRVAPEDRIDPWAWSPPGRWLFLATACAVLLALDANSRESYSASIMALPVCLLVAGVWLVRFLHAAWSKRLDLPGAEWLRWLAIPAIFFVALRLTETTIPYDVRLTVSRGAMDQAAAEVIAGGSTNRGWIGLYPAESVERTSNGMRFLIADSGFFDRIGLAYAVSGEPAGIDGTDEYQPLDGGWWRWVSKFN
jgi:hypothetical protein